MIDPNRLNRVHVKTVQARKDSYFVILSDGSEVSWSVWVASKARP